MGKYATDKQIPMGFGGQQGRLYHISIYYNDIETSSMISQSKVSLAHHYSCFNVHGNALKVGFT